MSNETETGTNETTDKVNPVERLVIFLKALFFGILYVFACFLVGLYMWMAHPIKIYGFAKKAWNKIEW